VFCTQVAPSLAKLYPAEQVPAGTHFPAPPLCWLLLTQVVGWLLFEPPHAERTNDVRASVVMIALMLPFLMSPSGRILLTILAETTTSRIVSEGRFS
jgi:hypothetical protein